MLWLTSDASFYLQQFEQIVFSLLATAATVAAVVLVIKSSETDDFKTHHFPAAPIIDISTPEEPVETSESMPDKNGTRHSSAAPMADIVASEEPVESSTAAPMADIVASEEPVETSEPMPDKNETLPSSAAPMADNVASEKPVETSEPMPDGKADIEGNGTLDPLAPGDVVVTFVGVNENNVFAMDSQSVLDLHSQDKPFGIWYWAAYVPDNVNKGVYPGLRGAPILLHWASLERTQGSYDWSETKSIMESAVAEGLYFSFELLVGPMAPEWLYEKGVPEVLTTEDGWKFPYYFDPLYLESFDQLNQEAVAFLKALPLDMARALNTVVLNDGSTGDPFCYKGEPLDSQYEISMEAWDEFRQENFQSIHDYLGTDGMNMIQLAMVHVSNDTQALIYDLFPTLQYFKNGMASHGYHIAENEASVIDVQRSQAFDGDPNLGGTRIRWFGEMDREWFNGWFQKAPVESFWWSAIYALHMGLSRWHVRGDALEIAEYHFAFDFFNKHAPYIDASASPYAFCALREGLDASDTVKFHESDFGTVEGEPLSRVLNILDKYAPYGAVVNNPSVTGSGAMQFRQRSDYVDVFHGGVRGNYHRFLYQIDPAMESIGWWHVGNNAQSPYGRFARSFDSSNNKNALYFRLDDRFISDKSAIHAVRISITYFDQGNGEWELLYNDPVVGIRSAVTVTCNDLSVWKKIQVDLYASVLNGGLDKGADLILAHIGGSDTKFHMIELDPLVVVVV